jgi:transcriptional regulator with XRE-family HTH domain
MLNRTQLGKAIRDARRRAGLTQQQLGDKLEITNVAISQFENAVTAPGLMTVAEIAEALDVSLAYLFGDPPAIAEYLIAEVRKQVRDLGYDIALIPREADVTANDQTPRSEWICGPECPKEA